MMRTTAPPAAGDVRVTASSVEPGVVRIELIVRVVGAVVGADSGGLSSSGTVEEERGDATMPAALAGGRAAEGELRRMAGEQDRRLKLVAEGAEKGLLARHLDDWVAEKRYAGQAEAYIHNCRRQVELIAEAPPHGWTRPEDFDADAIVEHLGGRRARGELEPSTANHIRAYGHTFFKWLRKKGRFAGENPFAQVPKVIDDRDATVGAFDDAELAAIREATRASKRARDRWLGWDFLAETGVRVGAANGLLVKMLRLDHHDGPRIEMPARLEKNKQARTVLLTPAMAEALRANVKGKAPTERVFSAVLKWDAFERDRARAGVAKVDAAGKKRSIHSLRHSFCSRLGRDGGGLSDRQIAALMGHKTVGRMQARYTERSLLGLKEVVAAMPSVLEGGDGEDRPPSGGSFKSSHPDCGRGARVGGGGGCGSGGVDPGESAGLAGVCSAVGAAALRAGQGGSAGVRLELVGVRQETPAGVAPVSAAAIAEGLLDLAESESDVSRARLLMSLARQVLALEVRA